VIRLEEKAIEVNSYNAGREAEEGPGQATALERKKQETKRNALRVAQQLAGMRVAEMKSLEKSGAVGGTQSGGAGESVAKGMYHKGSHDYEINQWARHLAKEKEEGLQKRGARTAELHQPGSSLGDKGGEVSRPHPSHVTIAAQRGPPSLLVSDARFEPQPDGLGGKDRNKALLIRERAEKFVRFTLESIRRA